MDRARIAAGLSMLVTAKDFTRRVKQIRQLAAEWQETPLLYGGALEPLNALLDVAITNGAAFDRLIELAQSKRRMVPETKRADYQRSLMREKRERLYKAVQLEELVRGKPLTGDAKSKYMRLVQAKWLAERHAHVKSKGNLSWKERNAAANEFWRLTDERLEHDLAEARSVLDRPPVKRKRVVQVAQPKTTALSLALTKAKAGKSSKKTSKPARR